ncbi:hypothetical protein N431DRAFT_486938 [Stipitochalara longipes BDJ]|nr:hypothetical protein N431DRAFT_486938 [Stipitochalara longipes BDJ]
MDGLSSTASVFAVVSLTTDILAGIAKLYTLYQSIKDAPQDISSLLQDLQQLCAALHYIEQQQQGFLDAAIKTLLTACTEKVATLQRIVETIFLGLQSTKTKKKIWNSYKAVQNKDRIIALRQSLEETKSTLILVLQLSQRRFISPPLTDESSTLSRLVSKVQDVEGRQEVLLNRTDGLLENLSDLQSQLLSEFTTIGSRVTNLESMIHMMTRVRGISVSQSENARLDCSNYSDHNLSELPSNPAKRRIKRKNILAYRPFYIRTLFGSIVFQFQMEMKAATNVDPFIKLPRQTTSIILHPASWATRWGLMFGIQMSPLSNNIGWKYVLLPIRSVSDGSVIFNFCKYGNINAVRELLSRGEASVSVTDSYGRQPLHFALQGRQLEMSRFLIASGADKYIRTYSGKTLLEYTTPLASPDWMEFVLLLEDLVDFSTPECSGWQLLRAFQVLDHGCSISSCLEWLFSRYLDTKFDSLDFPALYHAFFGAVMRNDCKAVKLILSLCPGISNYQGNSMSTLKVLTYQSYSVLDMFGILIDSAADLHQVRDGETATSHAMKYWTLFRIRRSQLVTRFQNFDPVLIRELDSPKMPLRLQGWSFDRLQRLFSLPFRPTVIALPDPLSCYHCEIKILRWERGSVLVDPWWEHLIDRIKRYICICCCLETCLEWIEASAKSTIQKLCGVHGPVRANECAYSRNNQDFLDRATACETCSTSEMALERQFDLDKIASKAPRVSLIGSPFIKSWQPKYGLAERFYGNGSGKPNSPPCCESDDPLQFGSRKYIRTMDWEHSLGKRFPRHEDIMTQFEQLGGWTKRYLPGQLYCFHCMSMFENWTDEASCESARCAEKGPTTMPGTFPLP